MKLSDTQKEIIGRMRKGEIMGFSHGIYLLTKRGETYSTELRSSTVSALYYKGLITMPQMDLTELGKSITI